MEKVGGKKIYRVERYHIEFRVSVEAYNNMVSIAKRKGVYVQNIALIACDTIFDNRVALSEIGLYFRRNLIVNKTIYMGCGMKNFAQKRKWLGSLPIAFNMPPHTYEALEAIAHALEMPIERAAELIMEVCFGEAESYYSLNKNNSITSRLLRWFLIYILIITVASSLHLSQCAVTFAVLSDK